METGLLPLVILGQATLIFNEKILKNIVNSKPDAIDIEIIESAA